MNKTSGLRTWIECSRSAIQNNIASAKTQIPQGTLIAGTIKSNAYGHGLVDTAKTIEKFVDYLLVDSIVEGVRLREKGIKKPILVLGYTLPNRYQDAEKYNIELAITSIEQLKNLQNWNGRALKIHVKVDTGMRRLGLLLDEMEEGIRLVSTLPTNVQVTGLYTHFAAAKNPAFPNKTDRQIQIFKEWKHAFSSLGIDVLLHTSASSGTLLWKEKASFDMVRLGIVMCGLWPSHESREYLRDIMQLEPVLQWKSIVAQVKECKAGEEVGYDFTEALKTDGKIAIIPVGYWHGYSRKLSGIGRVLVGGKKCKVIGRVSMDMIIVDVTDVEVKEMDEVVLIGNQGAETVTLYDMARADDTSWYETVTRINPLIKRFWN
jgi:alanine racemase